MAWLLLLSLLAGADPNLIAGVVRDSTGAAVPGASVVVRSPAGEARTVTGPDGAFSVDAPSAGELTLIVRAGGFAEQTQPIAESDRERRLDIVLMPAPLLETITVTASRTEERVGDVPASVTLLTSEEIRRSPAVVADDVLRQVPTFSLFRRSSSLSSHPTTQGVSLRGLGPSGVSRTLVLMDGVPVNDPFGGWVFWTRMPLQSIDRIEIVNGATSNLYGNFAMGGVINVIGSAPARRTLEVGVQYGNLNTPKVDVFGAGVRGKLAASVSASALGTDGFPIVIANERGKVDNKAAVNYGNLSGRVDYQPASGTSLFGRLGYFRENRDNGKASTIDGTEEANKTRWTSGSAGIRTILRDQSELQARLFVDDETFRSNFLAVPAATPPRSVGRMTLNQRVPTTGVGAMAQWSRLLGSRNQFQAGTDWRWVDGESQEDALDPVKGQQVILHRESGGTQRIIGAFAQDVVRPLSNLSVTLGVRLDSWRNYNGHNLETNVPAGTPTANNKLLPDRDDTVVSPRLAAAYRISERVNVWGDIGGGFRAPTLNELYRQFRVGALLTLPNDQLGPERLVGGEVGVTATPARNLSVRATWFDNRVKNPVSNVTITPNTVQQRQNLGRARIRGVQTEVDYLLRDVWHISGGYLFNRATVEEFATNPALVGNYLPQVPKHRGSLQVAYVDQRYATVALDLQFVGRQFDDDQNARVVPGESKPGLPGYTVADLSVSRTIRRGFEVFAGAQNLFDTEVIVGTLPTTIGTPRLVNIGVRVRVF